MLILLVVGNTGALGASFEAPFKSRREALGDTVVTIDDGAAVPANIGDYRLVVLGDTCVAGTLSTKYRDVAVGLVAVGNALWGTSTTALTASTPSSAFSGTVYVPDATHALAGGLRTGTNIIHTVSATRHFSIVTEPDAASIVRADNNAQAVVWGYEAGATMAGGIVAQRRRVALGMVSFNSLTSDGLAEQDSAVVWASQYTRSRIASISSFEMDRTKRGDGRWLWNVLVRRRGEVTWTNLSSVAGGDWVLSVDIHDRTPDSPVQEFTISFLRQTDGRSLAPGITSDPFNQVAGLFQPFIHPDDEVEAYAANLPKTSPDADAIYRKVVEGVVVKDEWPAGEVVITCKSLDFIVEDTFIEDEEERGAPDPGTPLTVEAQGLIDRWMETPIPVNAPDGDGIGIGPYKPAVGMLGAQIRELAGRQAWSAHYMWDNLTSSFLYTVYEPPRDKVIPDLHLSPDEVIEIPGLSEDTEALRNDFQYVFVDEEGREVRRNYRTVYPAGSPSYRRRPLMRIVDTSVVKTTEQADALLAFASNDISRPLAQKLVRTFFNPWIQQHDLLEFDPDDIRFDISTMWAVVGAKHGYGENGRFTDLELRGGGPVGQYYAWTARHSNDVDSDPEERNLYGFTVDADATGELWSWSRKSRVRSVRRAVGTFALPESADHMTELMSSLAFSTDDSLFIPYPPQGQYALAYVVPQDELLRKGQPWVRRVLGTPPEVRERLINVPESADGTTATVHAEMIDPRGVLTGCNVYLQYPGAAETGPFSASLVGTLTWEYTYALPADHGVYVKLIFPRNDGGEAYTWGPNLSDTDKIAGIPTVTQVWNGSSVEIRVDGRDTDTAALFYRPVVAGVAGAEVAILPRVSDPRFGAFTVTAGATELRYYIYGKNAAGEGGPLDGHPYKDEKVAIYYPPIDTTYAECLLTLISSTATTATVQANTVPAGGTVTLLAVTGSAVRLSGPLTTVASADGTQWVFTRGAINAGMGQAEFRANVSGYQPDTDFIAIEEQGRDTFGIQLRAQIIATTTSQVTLRVAASDPYPSANISLSYVSQGVASVTPSSPQTIVSGSVTSTLDTTGYVDFIINLGTTPGRVVFTGSATGRVADSDAVDLPSVFGKNGIAEVTSVDVATEGINALLTSHHDADTWVGTASGRYRVDGGSATTFDIVSGGLGYFGVTRSTSAALLVEVSGSLQDGTWGPWYPRDVDRYDPPPTILSGVLVSVEDTGLSAAPAAGDDVYTVFLQGSAMSGKTAEIKFYRNGSLRHTDTFSVTGDNAEEIGWTDVGAGTASSDTHKVVVQLYDAGTSTNYGAAVTSRDVPSFVS